MYWGAEFSERPDCLSRHFPGAQIVDIGRLVARSCNHRVAQSELMVASTSRVVQSGCWVSIGARAAFAFEDNGTFQWHYNLSVSWEIDCRIESRSLVPIDQPLGCLAARRDPPDEELEGPAVYPDWLASSSSARAVHQIEE
jgi:hypothetical protein